MRLSDLGGRAPDSIVLGVEFLVNGYDETLYSVMLFNSH